MGEHGASMMTTTATIVEVRTGRMIAHQMLDSITGLQHGANITNEEIPQLGRYGVRVRQVLTGGTITITLVMKSAELMDMTKGVIDGVVSSNDTFFEVTITHRFPDGSRKRFVYRNCKLTAPTLQGDGSSEITASLEFKSGEAPIIT